MDTQAETLRLTRFIRCRSWAAAGLATLAGLTTACNLQFHTGTSAMTGRPGEPTASKGAAQTRFDPDAAGKAQVDAFVTAFNAGDMPAALALLENNPAGSGETGPLVLVGERVGDDRLASALKKYVADHPLEGGQSVVFDQIYAYLKYVKRADGFCPAIMAELTSGKMEWSPVWAAGEQKCPVERSLLVRLFVAEEADVRAGAVFTVGELGYKDLVKKVQLLRLNDPYLKVRNTAATAMNKLLLAD